MNHQLTQLSCQKDQFYLEDDWVYLNCAYFSPLMKRVEAAGIRGIQLKRAPYHVKPSHFFSQAHSLHKAFSNLINCPNSDRVCSIPSISYGTGIVAKNLQLSAGDNIVVVEEQFPSNYYVWQKKAAEVGAKLKVVKAPGEDEFQSWNHAVLEAIDSRTRLVAMGTVHWADGTLFDLKAVRERTSDVDAWLVIDASQSLGALPFDVSEIQPDALFCVGYKWLMGHYSLCMAYFGEALEGGKPLEESWLNRVGSENFAGLVDYEDEYKGGAQRFNVGQMSNFVLSPMLETAINTLIEWQPERIQAYCHAISHEAKEQLRASGFIIGASHAAHLFGIRLPQHMEMKAIQGKLQANRIHVSLRGNSIRVSPHVYNTKGDFESLISCLIAF